MHKLNKSKKHRDFRTYLGLGLIVAPAVISGAVLSSAYVFAGNSAIDVINLGLSMTCSASTSGMDSHTAEVANGIYTPNIGTTTMNIICNDNGGFSIYATGFTGNEAGGTNSNKLVGTAVSDYSTIETGTATSAGDPDVSNWAMKLSSESQEDPITILDNYDAYHTVPNDFVKVATKTSGTSAGAEAAGATLTTTYAAYISKTQHNDDYSGKVKYTLVHPSDAPLPQTLYLQDTVGVIAALPNNGDTVIATDIRDDTEYLVGRLEDGNIWLLDNLELNLAAPGASGMITAANTNASAESLNALFNGVSGGGSGGNLARAAVVSGTDSSYTEPIVDSSYNGKTMADITDMSGKTGGDWMVGSYYNYCAASAGKYCYEDGYASGDSDEDICPSGWRMPTGEYSTGEYYDLYEAYNYDSEDLVNALRTPLSGYFMGGLAEYGNFWSSTNSGSSSMYYGGVSVHSGFSNGDSYRSSGYSVRCILTE